MNCFLETLQSFKLYFPDYKNKTVHAAVVYLKSENKAHLFVEEKDLFVIRATGDNASITNKKNFKPKSFS